MERGITDINGSFLLNNGVEIPYLGLGVFKNEDAAKSIIKALDCG